MTRSTPGIHLARVARNRTLCRDHFELTLALDRFPDAAPGQFVQVLCRPPNEDGGALRASDDGAFATVPMLRRPFSIGGMARTADGIEIVLLGRVVGPGTAWLNARREGDAIDVLGPLGRGFSVPDVGQTALLISGGIGLPPVRWLGAYLRERGFDCLAFIGAKTRDLLPVTWSDVPPRDGAARPRVEEFARYGISSVVTTDDGSCGARGLVTDALARHLAGVGDRSAVRVYACGPEAMLRAAAEICERANLACEVALERVMGCGMGTCQSCVVPVRAPAEANGRRYALCCTEGPVFDARQVNWPAIGTSESRNVSQGA